jgi:hypothetical protein
MTGIATFGLYPLPQQAVTGVYVQGTTGGFGTFTASNVTVPANGNSIFQASVTNNTALATSMTQFISPLSIAWSIGPAGTSCNGCVAVGTSSNPVYATLAQSVLPASKGPTMLTYVSLAVAPEARRLRARRLPTPGRSSLTEAGPRM